MAAVTSTIANGEATTTAVLCEADLPKAIQAADPTPPADGTAAQPTCAEGTKGL